MTSTDHTITPPSPHALSIAVFTRGLSNLKSLLRKGEAHALASGIPPGELLEARLASDMYNLALQVHWAAEGAKLAIGRLLGAGVAPSAGDATSFTELHDRLDAALAHLGAVDPRDLEGSLDRAIVIEHRGGAMKFTGTTFLMEFAIPSFFFHLTTAYALLRHAGVDVTKGDFLGEVGRS